MAYIYPRLKPRTTAMPISKQTFAGGYQNAVLEMQKQQMPVGMDPLRWREQQRANARRLAKVFGGGGGMQQHDRPVDRGGFTPGIDPSYQQWQEEMYGLTPQPIMLGAGQPRPGLGMGAGLGQPASGVAPTAPMPLGQRRTAAVRGRTMPSMYPRPRYTTNV